MKYLIMIIALLAIYCIYQNQRIEDLKHSNDKLEAEKTELNLVIERAKNAEMEANKRIATLKKSLQADKVALDWSRQLVPHIVIERLHKNTVH